MKNDVFEAKWSQDGSWADLGSIWVAKGGRLGRPLEGQVESKKGRKSHAKKGLVLAWSWGGVRPIVVGSLGAGGNKGETRWILSLILPGLVIFVLSCVVVCVLSCSLLFLLLFVV